MARTEKPGGVLTAAAYGRALLLEAADEAERLALAAYKEREREMRSLGWMAEGDRAKVLRGRWDALSTFATWLKEEAATIQ